MHHGTMLGLNALMYRHCDKMLGLTLTRLHSTVQQSLSDTCTVVYIHMYLTRFHGTCVVGLQHTSLLTFQKFSIGVLVEWSSPEWSNEWLTCCLLIDDPVTM